MFKKNKKLKSFETDIEVADLLLDAKVIKDFNQPYDFKIAQEFPQSRIKLLIFIFFLILVLLFLKIFDLGFLNYSENKNKALANASRIYPIKPFRGLIYDIHSRPLAWNSPSFDILIDPQNFNKEDINNILNIIAENDEKLKHQLKEKISKINFKSSENQLLITSTEVEKIFELKNKLINFNGWHIELNPRRTYHKSSGLSHILGYLGKNSKEEKNISKTNFYFNEPVGKTGLELTYDQDLKGLTGKKKNEVDALSNFKKETILLEPKDGHSLILNINLDYQTHLYNLLKISMERSDVFGLAAILTDLKGRIISMVSLPEYDNNLFIDLINPTVESKNNSKKIITTLNDSNNPLFNRAISGEYFPGSTIKPLIAAAALEEKIINNNTIINSSENIEIISHYDKNKIYRFKDWRPHGPINLNKALAFSSNIFFYTIGGGNKDKNFKGLGVDSIESYLKSFNLGKSLNIDLPNEKTGFVPSASWKEKTFKEKWFIGDTYNLSTGEAYLLATPLQMTMAITAIINGGKIYRPYLVSKIIDNNNNTVKIFEPKIISELPIKHENLKLIKEGMKSAAQYGTANVLSNLAKAVGAKTGTAQLGQIKRSWTIAFAPYDNPELVLTILIEGGTGGGSTVAPIIKDFFEWQMNYKL